MASLSPEVEQKARWTFTLNNYNENVNYKDYLSRHSFRIKRPVWGYEISSNNVPHLQGYMELERSFRRSHVLKILPSAHWEGANGDSLANYRYCTKDGRYDVIGDFSREEIGQPKTAKKPISSSIIIKALLNPMTALQAKLTKEYAFKHFYFDKIASQIKVVETQISLFNRFRNSKLFPWQYQCLKLLMDQGPRQILWLVDVSGGLGKTYFGHYLCGNYGFKMLDGNVSSRDLGQLLKGNEHGFCFDVCRDSMNNFCYSALEAIKNGYVVSGKYAGKICIFNPLPVVVFANAYPDMTKLSMDRWLVHTLGEGLFMDVSKNAVIVPSVQYPFVEPPPYPDLSEDFDLEQFVRQYEERATISRSNATSSPSGSSRPSRNAVRNSSNVSSQGSNNIAASTRSRGIQSPTIATTPINNLHTSQIAGPSTTHQTNFSDALDSQTPQLSIHPMRTRVCPKHKIGKIYIKSTFNIVVLMKFTTIAS